MMDQNSNYFFNSSLKDQREFWNRNFHILLNNHENFEIQNENCTRFYKRSKILKQWIPRLYSVQGNYLLYGDRNLKGFIKLDCVYLITDIVEGLYKYKLELIYSGFVLELYTDQKKDYDSFKETLQSHCILTDFNTQYTLLRQIGFGSSAQVYIARNTANKNQKKLIYAIKYLKIRLLTVITINNSMPSKEFKRITVVLEKLSNLNKQKLIKFLYFQQPKN